MAEELEKVVAAMQEAVTKQGDTVRSLKASLKEGKTEKVEFQLRRLLYRNVQNQRIAQASVDAAIAKLQELKVELDGKQKVNPLS